MAEAKLIQKNMITRSPAKKKRHGFTRKCASLVQDQRARIYVFRRCATMLLCCFQLCGSGQSGFVLWSSKLILRQCHSFFDPDGAIQRCSILKTEGNFKWAPENFTTELNKPRLSTGNHYPTRKERWQEWKLELPWKTSRRKWLTLRRKETGISFIALEISSWPWWEKSVNCLRYFSGEERLQEGYPDWKDEEKEHLGEELSDVLLYLVRLSDVCGVDLGKAAMRKLEVNAIKYPVKLCKGSSKKHTQINAGNNAGGGITGSIHSDGCTNSSDGV
ncbi:hypothetical protein OIU77_024375 [Salix suchowensis]|uniref:dCTP pyrophosphatase 1 n=1 Tax=Salix suchowensis TaxID=1278906 RepID=A0ABQ9BSI6_9ROSI|nr:hypothetical protein OIU77_024375 [Salix suchowensis]